MHYGLTLSMIVIYSVVIYLANERKRGIQQGTRCQVLRQISEHGETLTLRLIKDQQWSLL